MVVSGFYRKCEQLKDIRHHQDPNDPRCYYNILEKYFSMIPTKSDVLIKWLVTLEYRMFLIF
jgi:hypothetical protein